MSYENKKVQNFIQSSINDVNTDLKSESDIIKFYRMKMGEINNELLSYMKRLEEMRYESSDKLTLLKDEKSKRDQVYLLQKQISDTAHVLSEEREHFLNLWRDNDLLKVEKARHERKLLEYANMCNPEGSNYVVEDKGNTTQKYLQKMGEADKRNIWKPYNANRPCSVAESKKWDNLKANGTIKAQPSNSALGYYTRNVGNIVEKPRNLIRTVYLPNQESLDMGSEINSLKSACEENRAKNQELIKELRDERRSREAEYWAVHDRDSKEIESLLMELERTEETILDTNKDMLTLEYEYGQREQNHVEELEAAKRINAQLRLKLHGTVNNAVNQTEIFSKQSEIQTEDLANKFRVQQMRAQEEHKIVLEQTEFLKKIMNSRVEELEGKLLNYEVKFNNLQARRDLDFEGFVSDAQLVKRRTKELEDKMRKKINVGDKEDILHDVKKLKDEIKEFQSRIMPEERELEMV